MCHNWPYSDVNIVLFSAIGVPVLLLYVYGVVPISLYRTGSVTGGKGQPMASNVAAMIPGLRFDISSSALATRPMSQEEGNNFQPRSSMGLKIISSWFYG